MNTPTPPLEELAILLSAGAYWADETDKRECCADYHDPIQEVQDIVREADNLIKTLPAVYHSAPALFDALHYLLEQSVDMDLKHGITLSEGEQYAREKALAVFAHIHLMEPESPYYTATTNP